MGTMPQNWMALLLWAEHFDELAALAFTVAFRKVGLPLKVVGAGRQARDRAITRGPIPNTTLVEAIGLAARANAIVIPAGAGDLQRLSHQPMVRNLLDAARLGDGFFVTGTGAYDELSTLVGQPSLASLILCYPKGPGLTRYAFRLALEIMAGEQCAPPVRAAVRNSVENGRPGCRARSLLY
jgi:hypothetical protein